jgi:hypothetical protein
MHFYATRNDIEPVLREVEAAGRLVYVRTGQFPTDAVSKITSALCIPTLGVADADDAVRCPTYLVAFDKSVICARRIVRNSGEVCFAVDQLMNPDTITFSYGGLRDPKLLLYGRVATASKSAQARKLMRLFETKIRKSFIKHGAYYVGDEARILNTQGFRLTLAAQTPQEFDLVW